MTDANPLLQDLTSRLDAVRKQLRSTRRSVVRNQTLPKTMWNVACVLVVMTYPDLKPACLYLEQKRNNWQDIEVATKSRLEQWYQDQLPGNKIDQWRAPSTPHMSRLHVQAETFMMQMKLHRWVEHANLQQSIAPNSRVLMRQAAAFKVEHKSSVGLARGSTQKSRAAWLRRWRGRWKVGLGHILPRDTLSIEAGHEKVSHSNTQDHNFQRVLFFLSV